ncbi:hypothetical protein HYQ46_004518 [Verticillium longisporum]|nr:hypothetical protein HYQ46_004518 [Verticillium longisporum]
MSTSSSSPLIFLFFVGVFFFPLLTGFGTGLWSSSRKCGIRSLKVSYPGSLKARISSKTACSLSLASIMRSMSSAHGGSVRTLGECFLLSLGVTALGHCSL